MQEYNFYYKRAFFWSKEKVVGHGLDGNTMTLWKKDGSLMTIAQWDKFSMKLESDWILAVKKNTEQQTGVELKLKG